MIPIEQIRNYFPDQLRKNSIFDKHILKEYLQLMMLDYLSSTPYIRKIVFIGGTNLRLVKGIDRFSEGLDFDCTDLSQDEFIEMTNEIIRFLKRSGLRVETKDKDNPRLTAFRRNIYFPELLFALELSGHKEERFFVKVESQGQGVAYPPVITNIKGCGFFFPFPVPSDGVLCSMKIAAMLARSKGRDFYDVMFLLAQTKPDYSFLSKRCGVHNLQEFKQATAKLLETVDLKKKQKDFEHLLFNKTNSGKILRCGEFVDSLTE
ncbi:nucleotidyl transferase AbiEii/AbiGii toxin family protein [Microbacter margulisiae]|uniref:Putative nucleotidyltransferase component of viral defense system n=1 Tax=Microbacter margulisiae TaxID=1350067 RepID=A0A7W5DQF6_9PORP|nr:nucleotidyl transferase AbiEii/AbiGii toxin family protein [Microbacter margulisiae]MBB3187180.1 putative nucleotidyltransferase component of viral defense system [Microbacter margulisiae]